MIFLYQHFFAYFIPNHKTAKMKYLTYFLAIALLGISCQSKDTKSTKNESPEAAIEYVLYKVQIGGMTCTGCEKTIEAGVNNIKGISAIEASHLDGTAQIKFVKGQADTTTIKKVIESAGYKVKGFMKLSDVQLSE